MNDDITDEDLVAKVPLTRGTEIAHLLGRIEVTLKEMRRDIQAGNLAQIELTKDVVKLDRRVMTLEGKEGARKLVSRVVAVIALAVLSATIVPAIKAAGQLHNWFSAVDRFCFPGKR